MRFDEVLLCAVLVMLTASIYMGWCVQRSLYHSRKAFEVLIEEISAIKRRVAELEK